MLRSTRLTAGTALVFAALLTAGWLAGCSSNSAATSNTPQVTVTISGAADTRLGSTTQFSASVTGTSNTAVQWAIDGVVGGSAANGTISTGGLYTAPATMPSPNTVTVTAVSVVSPTASNSLAEALYNPTPTIGTATGTQIGSSLNYTVDVLGSGFVPSSIIQAGGVAQTTTYISANEVDATVTVPSGTTSLNVAVDNPAPGASNSATVNIPLSYFSTTATAAARILDQSTFGPTAAMIQHVQTIGIDAYIKEQFAEPTTTLAAIPTNPLPPVCVNNNSAYPCAESE